MKCINKKQRLPQIYRLQMRLKAKKKKLCCIPHTPPHPSGTFISFWKRGGVWLWVWYYQGEECRTIRCGSIRHTQQPSSTRPRAPCPSETMTSPLQDWQAVTARCALETHSGLHGVQLRALQTETTLNSQARNI